MYRILYNDQIIFDPYGDGEIVTDAKMSTEVNAASYLDFTMSPLHPLYNTIKERDGIVRLYYNAEELFEGVIETIETDFNGYKSISCVSALDYLNDTLVRPYSTVDGEEPLTAPSEIDSYFQWLIDQHNDHVLDSYKKFSVGVNQGSNLSTTNELYVKQDSSSTTANEITTNLIDAFGGYLMLRYVEGNLVLDLYADVHDMNPQIIDFGVNLLDFNKTVDTADQYTAIRPVGGTPEKKNDSDPDPRPATIESVPDGPTMYNGDVTKEGDVIYSISGVARYGYKETEWKTDDTTDPEKLLELAVPQLVKQSSPQLNIDIKAVDLALYMDGYEHLRVGQAVRIRSNPHGVDEYMMVSSIDLDLQDPGQSDYQLGVSYDTLTGQQSAYLRNLNNSINGSLDAVASLDQITKDHAIQIGHVTEIAEEAQDTANNAQNTADSNKQEIDQIKDQQSEQDKLIEQMQQGVEQAEQEISGINDRLDQMDTEAGEVQASIDAVRQEAQTNFETAKAAADAAQAKADSVGADLESFRTEVGETVQNVKQSVSDVQSDVDAVEQKAADLASELDGTKATVEQVTTDLGEVKTTVSNAATKADQALQVSTSASQTATEAKTTATSAYRDAQSALTQSSVASQTANAVKTELETKYSTTDEIAEQYATKSLVEQTSQSITSTVEATYATKATVEALENIANNAVQTWMGSGVPTLSNKPASDWTTAELKSQHSGDIYYDTDTGYSYRFGSSDGKNYSWSLIKDTDISKAVADAAKAQQTAEGVSDEVTQLKTDIPATYATKTEVKQTTDSIKSSVSEVATTANSALSKATTVEQTAKGLQTTVTEQAEKLDSAVTTISQVSQRVDSVSSTITQVSGRVDDVEDKADAAQGTANSAMSQASRVEQSLDSFKTSVSRDYQTKTEALSQKSELEQNINSFKTTVSETYTTKDEFNALEIGGTNLIKGSKPYGKSGFFEHFNSVTDNEYGELTLQSTTTSQSYPNVTLDYSDTFTFDKTDIVTGDKYVISYDVMMLERTYTASSIFTENWIGIRHNGGNRSGLIKYDGIKNDFLSAPLNKWAHFEHSITANAWDGTTNIRANIQLGTRFVGKFRFRMRNVKLEKGSKATAWSPAPEDFDGKYTSKTEFKQTTDKISATATAASQNASSALSKISSLEVSVDGIDTRVEEVASDADEAVKTASQVSQRVDSLSSTITQVQGDVDSLNASVRLINPSFETGDTTGWKFFGYQQEPYVNNVEPRSGTYKLVFPSINAAGNISLENDAKFPVKAGEVYRISLSVNPDRTITAVSVGLKFSDGSTMNYNPQFSSGWHEYSGTVTIPSGKTEAHFRLGMNVEAGNNVRVDSVLIENISDAKTATDTANSALSKSSSVEQSLNSFKTSVSQTYETKSDASSKQSSLQQSVNNLRTEVSETYTTKTDFGNLNNSAVKTYSFTTNVNSTGWYKLGTWSKTNQCDICAITIYAGAGQNARADQNRELRVYIKDGYQATSSASGAFGVTIDRIRNADNAEVQVRATAGNSCDVWYKADTTYAAGRYTVSVDSGTTWKHSGSYQTSAPSSGTLQPQEYQTYSTKSYVDQTSRTVSLGVVEEYKKGQHGSALATQADITATKNSITQTVSQTYLSKTDATNTYLNKNTAASTYATKTEVKQTSDSLTVTISSAVSKAESAATAASNAQNTANNAQSTANTANTNAANAQLDATNANNRVGNLETCIKMTSDGVRVGKISNGNFTGYSALVNSAGSFDILGSNSKNVVSFGPTATRFYDSNGNAKLAMLYNPSSSLYQVGTVSSNSAASIDSGFTVDGQWLKLESINRNIEISAANGRILLKPSGDHDNQQNGISFYSGVRFENDGTALRHIYRGSLVANPHGANGLTITRARQHMTGDVCVAINGDWQANRLVVMGCDYDNGNYNVRLYNWGGSFSSSVRIDWCVFEVDEFTPQ